MAATTEGDRTRSAKSRRHAASARTAQHVARNAAATRRATANAAII